MNYNVIKAYARQNRKNATEAEKFFWKKVRNRKFLELKINRQFVIQHTQIVAASKKYFIADFFCHEFKLIIEIDGAYHSNQLEYDKMRDDVLFDLGYKTIRFTNDQVLLDWENTSLKLSEVILRLRGN